MRIKSLNKLIAISLVAGMAFSISACGKNDTDDSVVTEAVTENAETTEEASSVEEKAETEAPTEGTTSTEEKAETEAPTEAATAATTEAQSNSVNMAEDFFNGNVSIRFSDSVTTSLDYGSIDKKEFANEAEFFDNLKNSNALFDFSTANVTKENYKLTGGNVNAYLLKYNMSVETESYSFLYIAIEKNGGLEITFADDMWSRKDVNITSKGLVTSLGSGGAGFHVGEVYVPDANFNYTLLYRECQAYPGFTFGDIGDEKESTVNEIINEYSSSNGDSGDQIYFGQTVIGSDIYYYFLGDSITQEKVDQIDAIASKYNFTFDGYSTVENKINEKVKSLGAEDVYKDMSSTLY